MIPFLEGGRRENLCDRGIGGDRRGFPQGELMLKRCHEAVPVLMGVDVLLDLGPELRQGIPEWPGRPSAKPQIVVPGMMPRFFTICSMVSRSSIRPPPALMRRTVLKCQPVPSRQGVHWPQLSWAKNRAVLYR